MIWTLTVESLQRRWASICDRMAALGVGPEQLISQSFVTPACDMRYLSLEEARRGLQVLAELSRRGREWLAAF